MQSVMRRLCRAADQRESAPGAPRGAPSRAPRPTLRALAWRLGLLAFLLLAATGLCARPRLLLAGGHLPVCTSAAPEACERGRAPSAAAQRERFRLDAAALKRVGAGGWLPQRSAAKKRLVGALTRWHQRAGTIHLPGDDLAPALAGGSSRDARAWTDLADFERDRVWDALEREPLQERVDLAASIDDSSVHIFREFVAMARAISGRERPHILISTASGRDPFASIEFYRAVFEQAGGQARWLPLDHALRAAQLDAQRNCAQLDRLRGEHLAAHDRDRLYPQRAAQMAAACSDPARLDALIDWADGVFLNGGDQSFMRAAWFAADGAPSPQLRRLLARLDAGALVLGGTSAGTAVQAARPTHGRAAMIVSGSGIPGLPATAITGLPPYPDCAAAQACAGFDPDTLLYHPGGGLGSFGLGVLDTHFSDRGRDYRLTRLLIDSGTAVGVGIDETTALRIDVEDGALLGRVIGRGGVSVMQRIDDTLVLRRRYLPDEVLELAPVVPPIPVCVDGDGAAEEVSVDGDPLRHWLDTVRADLIWHPLVLTAGTDREVAGSVCAAPDGRSRWWRLPAATGNHRATE